MTACEGRVSRLEAIVFDWFSRSSACADPAVRARLFAHIPAPLYVHLIGLLNTVLLAVLLMAHTGAAWPAWWIGADIVLTSARMGMALHCRRAIRRGRIAPLERLIEVAVAWVVVTSAGLAASVATGDTACVVLATGMAAVTTGTAIVRNSAIPRYACFVILSMGLPMCVAFMLSSHSGLWIVGIQLGIGVAGMCAMAWQNHGTLAGLERARIEIARLARRDTLTGLGNRIALYDKLGRWIDRLAEAPEAARQKVAVLFLDLDRFKEVNDGLGHAAGDALLREVGGTIAAQLGPDNFACRSGGDEFVIVMRGAETGAVEAMAQRIIAAITRPLDIGWPEPVRIGGSIGIAMAPDHGLAVDELLSRADAALYRAKSDGRGLYRLCA